MNKYSLTFIDQQLEKKFQASTYAKSLIQCKMLTILLTIEDLLVIINAFINEYYIASAFLISSLFLYTGFYIILLKYPLKRQYGIFWFNLFSFLSPIAIFIYIQFLDVQLMDKICLTVGAITVIPQLIITQNIFFNSGIYLYAMIATSIFCLKLVGFSWFLSVPPLFSISWISQRYQSIKLERTFFSESQTNECLATVLRRICKEKIMIFTYDDTNIKYQEYLLNDECNKYFQDCPINQILSNIFVTYNEIQVSMGSYIHRNIIQNHNEDEFYSEAFQGYFKEKKNKINIELYVQTTSKTFFTIKITEIQKENCFSKTKAKQLLQIQNKVLHKILPKYIEIFQRDLQLTTKFQLFYKFMNQQISILRLHIVCNSKNIQFIIKRFDLVHQISQQFNKVNRRFFLQLNKNKEMDPEYQQLEQIQEAFISSDQFLMGMFLENILMLIRVTIDQDSLVNIQVIQEGDYIRIEFQYQSLQQLYISDKNYQKLVKSLGKLTELIGIKGSLVIKQSIIQITLINFLEISYQ